MTAPHPTPNPATTIRPQKSSRRTTHKSPLGWLPWALLGLLALLLALVFLVVNAVDDDGPAGDAGDSLGQVGRSGGSGINGANGVGGAPADPDAGRRAALAALSRDSLVGGAAVRPLRARELPGAAALATQPGTAGTVLFAEGSAQLDVSGQQVVQAAAQSLQGAGARTVEVVGHTDQVAGAPVNDTLSQQRADNVAKALRGLLPGVQVLTAARGQNEPIAANDTEDNRQLNRRAVLTARG